MLQNSPPKYATHHVDGIFKCSRLTFAASLYVNVKQNFLFGTLVGTVSERCCFMVDLEAAVPVVFVFDCILT